MSVKTRQRALMYVIGKKVKGLVDVKEHTNHSWIGYPTYLIRYEHCDNRGSYIDAEFLPSEQTQKEIDKAMAELEFQKQGLEFPEVVTK